MGWSEAAFLAGYQPKRTPIPTETKKANIIELKEMVKIEELVME